MRLGIFISDWEEGDRADERLVAEKAFAIERYCSPHQGLENLGTFEVNS